MTDHTPDQYDVPVGPGCTTCDHYGILDGLEPCPDCGPEPCPHTWLLDRPESDTWQCLDCGTEGTGTGPVA